MKSLKLLLLAASLAAVVVAPMGCSGGSPQLDTAYEKERLDKMTTLRSYFDKVNGDYTALSAEDKAAFLKLCDGDQAKADVTWKLMKEGPSGGGRPGGPSGP
jgi:hypothetical protein